MKKRIISIDLIRSLSMIFIVCILHFSQYTVYEEWYTTRIAKLFTGGALSSFIFISGYLTSRSFDNDTCLSFFGKRFFRLYPLFIISAVLLFIIGDLSPDELLRVFVINLGDLFPSSPRTLWYICMLFLFYLLTPLIMKPQKLYLKIIISFAIFAALVAFVYFVGSDSRLLNYFPFYIFGLLFKDFKIANKISRVLLLIISVLILSFSTLVSIYIYIYIYKNNQLCAYFAQ